MQTLTYKNTKADFYLDNCLNVLKDLPSNTIDLIITSPPYSDQRNGTYGGIHPDKYVEWFLPKSGELLRVLKPTGTFMLNIKEKVVNGERHTYVIDLILDPFLGSGTTSISASLLNRNSVGIEILPEYYNIAVERFKDETGKKDRNVFKKLAKVEENFSENQLSLLYV